MSAHLNRSVVGRAVQAVELPQEKVAEIVDSSHLLTAYVRPSNLHHDLKHQSLTCCPRLSKRIALISRLPEMDGLAGYAYNRDESNANTQWTSLDQA